MQAVEELAVVVAAIAIDAITGGLLTPILGAATAAIIGGLAAAGVMALGTQLITPAQKRTLTVRDPIATHKIIVGQMKVGGAMTFIDTSSDNSTLFLVITLTGHPVASIDGIYVNDTFVPLDSSGQAVEPIEWPDGSKPTNYSGHCQVLKGLGTVAGDAAMISAIATATPKWGANFFQYSRAKIYVRLGWNTNLFGSTGVPNISAVVRGRMVYDPRNTGTVINASSTGTPGLFDCAGPHNLVPGQMVFIKGHSGAFPISQASWPAAQRNAVAQEYEIGTTPASDTFTLIGIDSQPLALSAGGTGGTVTAMTWTDNSQLVMRDYLVEPVHGMGVIYDTEVDANSDISGANICDEIVARILPTSTFTADPTLNQITYVENDAAGPLPPLCQVVLSVSSGGTMPGGLSAGVPYYYAQVGAGPVGVLCTTSANAAHNPPINVDITSAGTGTFTLEIVESITFDTSGNYQMDVYNNALRITTGTEVILSNSGGSPPSPLSTSVAYYAIFIADTVLQLAATLEDARAGNAIAFSGSGSGTTFISVEAEPRYTCNGMIDTAEMRQSIMQKILTSMGGYLVPSGTLLNVYPAAYITPTVTLDETDLRGPVQLTALQSGTASFNSVKGTFIDPFNKGQPTDYPQLQNTTYIQEDNYETVWSDLTLEYTNSSSMAQRLAKISLERIRRELTPLLPLKLTAFRVGSPDTIYLNNAQLGWLDETFEVSSWRFSIGGGTGGQTLNCDVAARQTDDAVYAWTAAEEAAAKRQTNTNLPNPFVVQPPTGLTLTSGGSLVVKQQDGTVVSRIEVSWTAPVDQFVINGGFIEIVYAPAGSGNWQSAATVPGDQTFGYIENAEIGASYDIAIRSRNTIGGVSDIGHPWQAETDGYTVQGYNNAPTDISSITVFVNGMTVVLSGSPIPDTDLVAYEYRYGSTASWSSMTLIQQAAAMPNGSGGFAGAVTTGSVPAGTWYFAVKALNRSGTYSVNAAFSTAHTITNTVAGGSIAPGTLTDLAFAAGIKPIYIVSGAPPSGSGTYVGQVVVSTTDQQLYRWTGSAWTLAVPAVNVTGTLTAAQIASITAAQITGQITTTQITPGAVTTPLLAAGAVNTANLAAGAVVASTIASGTITSTNIAAGTITGTNIASSTLTSGNIAANAIQAGQVAAGAINASAIIVGNIIVTGHLVANAATGTDGPTFGAVTMTGSQQTVISGHGTSILTGSNPVDVSLTWTTGATSGTLTVNLSITDSGSSVWNLQQAYSISSTLQSGFIPITIPLGGNLNVTVKVTGPNSQSFDCWLYCQQVYK